MLDEVRKTFTRLVICLGELPFEEKEDRLVCTKI